MHIDETTGMPYVYSNTAPFEKLPYKPEEYCVPEQYRQFLYMRGHLFHEYTREVEKEYSVYECSPADILTHWPSWDDMKKVDELEYYDWSEADHNLLKEGLEWFKTKGHFHVEWSY